MTPGKFEFHRPTELKEAVSLLSEYGEAAQVLAGGHSLLPMMKLRLATPEHLVDINSIAGLKGIAVADGVLRIGAATTQSEVLRSELVTKGCPLLTEAVLQIADPQVRNCGTVGGNVANGDPGNDLPAVMIALGASYLLVGTAAEREVAAVDFYEDLYATAKKHGELLTAVRIPVLPTGHGWSYQKMKRKIGDYATAAAAVILTLKDGKCDHARVALTNVASTAIDAEEASNALIGRVIDEQAISDAAEKAIAAADPVDDLRGPAEFRKQMAGEMTRRAIRTAVQRAGG